MVDGLPNAEWEQAHRAFHRSLIAACRSSRVIGYCDQLFDASDQYRNIARAAPMSEVRPIAAEHRAIMEATVGRRADEAVAHLLAHFDGTAEIVRRELARSSAQAQPRTRPAAAGAITSEI